jgi:hypothetical protein
MVLIVSFADEDQNAAGSLQLEDGSDAPTGDGEDGGGTDELHGGGYGGGMFGSLQWSQDDLLNSVSAQSTRSRQPHTRSAHTKDRRGEGSAETEDASSARLDSQSQSAGEQLLVREPKEHHLVLGLKPMRDKYLITALGRMSAPIAQMFPELEGYTGEQRESYYICMSISLKLLHHFVPCVQPPCLPSGTCWP